jgi:1-acyl-sn-glycerol-3-phosphate acyltransferase
MMPLLSTACSAVRSTLFLLWMALTVVPWFCVVLLVSIFVRGTPVYWVCASWLGMCVHSCRVICGVRWRVQGMHNIPQEPAVLLAKHQSTWETFAFPLIMPKPLCYVFKRELLYIPFFGWSMARMDMIHINRGKKAQAWVRMIRQGRQHIAKGNSVIMFPEGTRAARGGQEVYKSGGARLAMSLKAPVLPIAVTSARCWPRKSFLIRPGVVDVSIGPAISCEGRTADELNRAVEFWIETEMRRLDPQAYAQAIFVQDLAPVHDKSPQP